LLADIYAKMDKGDIQTWMYDTDGDLVHTAASGQWQGKAWLRPEVDQSSGKLTLRVIPPKVSPVTVVAYAVYHGRFIEMLLTHFDQFFITAHASALPGNGDQVKADS